MRQHDVLVNKQVVAQKIPRQPLGNIGVSLLVMFQSLVTANYPVMYMDELRETYAVWWIAPLFFIIYPHKWHLTKHIGLLSCNVFWLFW